jgi:hypothetical protein
MLHYVDIHPHSFSAQPLYHVLPVVTYQCSLPFQSLRLGKLASLRSMFVTLRHGQPISLYYIWAFRARKGDGTHGGRQTDMLTF